MDEHMYTRLLITNQRNRMNTVIYHKNCTDGFAAAWVCNKFLKVIPNKTNWIEANYGDEDKIDTDKYILGNIVYIVDLSFSRSVLEHWREKADFLFVIDHHASAERQLADLPYCKFDMSKSGALLAWKHFFNDLPVPGLIQYTNDYDLWKHQLLHTHEINAFIKSYDRTFERFDWLDDQIKFNYDKIVFAGTALLKLEKQIIDDSLRNVFKLTIGDHKVKVINNPVLISKTVGEMAKGEPFAAAFYFDGNQNKFFFSLRSDEDGLDVSKIAELYNGGGHTHAAGFSIGLNEFSSLLNG